MMRQAIIAILAMVLVLAVAGYEDLRSKATVPKVRLSSTVTQWSTLDTSERDRSLHFRLGAFPHELAIDAPALELLAKQGMTEPFNVGSRVDAIIAKSEVAARESGSDAAAIPVLALLVEGQPVFGSPDALRLTSSMRTWPYLLLLSTFGAALFFRRKRLRRSTRRRSRRVDYDEEDSSSG
jgi:hypothetical protein